MSGAWIQDLAVGLIVLGAVAFLVRRQLRRRAKPTALCGDCPGCTPAPAPEQGKGLVRIEALRPRR